MYNRIKKIAQEKGKTLQQVEKEAMIGQGLISKWKRSPRPNITKLEAVAKVLGVTVVDLLKED